MIESRALLKSWFETGDLPTQEQFWALIDSFYHKTEDTVSPSATEIRNALQTLVGNNRLLATAILTDAFNRFVTDIQVGTWDAKATTGQITDAINALKDNVPVAGDTLRKLYESIQTLQSLVASNDVNLDTVQEIVNFIKDNATDLEALVVNKVNKSDIVDNLHSTDAQRPLSANQGSIIKGLIDALTLVVNGKQNNLGFTPENIANKGQANGYAGLDSAGKVPSAQLPEVVAGGLDYKGAWNASINNPAIPAAAITNKSWYYKVSVAGNTDVSGITDWNIGDWVVSNGTAWEKIDQSETIKSVNGKTGDVVLNKADIGLPLADNTPDNQKPVSIPQQDAINAALQGQATFSSIYAYQNFI